MKKLFAKTITPVQQQLYTRAAQLHETCARVDREAIRRYMLTENPDLHRLVDMIKEVDMSDLAAKTLREKAQQPVKQTRKISMIFGR